MRQALLVPVIVGALLGPASALLPSGDAKCRASLAAGVRKLAVTTLKQELDCHKQRMLGQLGSLVSCGVSSLLPAASLAKVAAAESLLQKLAAAGCSAAAAPIALGYEVCADPCPIAITDYPSTAQCLACLTKARVDTLIQGVFADPPAPVTGDSTSACGASIGKGSVGYVAARIKQPQTCQKLLDKGTLPAATSCKLLDPAPAGSKVAKFAAKLAKARAKYDKQIASCDAAVDLAVDLSSCAADIASEQLCVAALADVVADSLFDAVYDPPGPTPTPTSTTTATRTPTRTRTPTKTPVVAFTPTPTPTHPGGDALTIFVSASLGSDANPGTRLLPKKSIQAGINAAVAGKRVCVDQGAYVGSIVLKNGVSVEGGFDSSLSWSKTSAPTVIDSTSTTGIFGNGVHNLTLRDLHVFALGGHANAPNSYGVQLVFSSSVTIDSCFIAAGKGDQGFAGANGANGEPGFPTDVSPHNCLFGGTAGHGGSAGLPGGAASSGAAGGPLHASGSSGGNGNAGTPGVALGSFALSNYSVPNPGGNGTPGFPAGGGGGGGSVMWGGLAGSGGCGGQRGFGGGPGGGSFGVYLYADASVPNSEFTITNTVIQTGGGGNGGNGGAGGTGGHGGAGGWPNNVSPLDMINFPALKGGDGGAGGRGGDGGGGGGGPSYGIVCVNNPFVMRAGNSHDTSPGGTGGSSSAPGASGPKADSHNCGIQINPPTPIMIP